MVRFVFLKCLNSWTWIDIKTTKWLIPISCRVCVVKMITKVLIVKTLFFLVEYIPVSKLHVEYVSECLHIEYIEQMFVCRVCGTLFACRVCLKG